MMIIFSKGQSRPPLPSIGHRLRKTPNAQHPTNYALKEHPRIKRQATDGRPDPRGIPRNNAAKRITNNAKRNNDPVCPLPMLLSDT